MTWGTLKQIIDQEVQDNEEIGFIELNPITDELEDIKFVRLDEFVDIYD